MTLKIPLIIIMEFVHSFYSKRKMFHNFSHSDQVKQLTNMSVNLSLKALKEMDCWKEHNNSKYLFYIILPPKLLGSSWFNVFEPLICPLRVKGSVFCMLTFDICVEWISGAVYLTTTIYESILTFYTSISIKVMQHAKIFPHTEGCVITYYLLCICS